MFCLLRLVIFWNIFKHRKFISQKLNYQQKKVVLTILRSIVIGIWKKGVAPHTS